MSLLRLRFPTSSRVAESRPVCLFKRLALNETDIQRKSMDLSMLGTAITCLTSAADIGKSIANIRDATVANGKIIEIQELLLKAQHSLFGHNVQLQQLQQENFDLR